MEYKRQKRKREYIEKLEEEIRNIIRNIFAAF